MKTKQKKLTNHQKAVNRMEAETARAIAHVQKLSKMYQQLVKK